MSKKSSKSNSVATFRVSEIQPVQYWKHPLSDDSFDSQEAAQADFEAAKRQRAEREAREAKCAEAQAAGDILRLTATSIEDVKRLIIKQAKQYLGVKIEFNRFGLNFGLVRTSHSAPIGQPTIWEEEGNVLGWSGHVEGTITIPKTLKNKDVSFSDLFREDWFSELPFRFNAIHIGWGSSTPSGFGYSLYIFIDDFPKLKEAYTRYALLTKERSDFASKASNAEEEACDTFNKEPATQAVIANIGELSRQSNELYATAEKLMNKLAKKREDVSKKAVDALRLKSQFSKEEANKLDSTFVDNPAYLTS